VFTALCFANDEQAIKFQDLSLHETDNGLIVCLENSGPPLDFKISKKGFQINIYLHGVVIGFRPYENVPIEIPVNKNGIKEIVIEQTVDARNASLTSVKMKIYMSVPFSYSTDSQWNGKFITIDIITESMGNKMVWVDENTELAPSKKLEKIREIQEKELAKVRGQLDGFTNRTVRKLTKEAVEKRLSEVSIKSEEKLVAEQKVDKAYEKFKAETSISKIPLVRQHLMGNSSYTDMLVPEEIKPVPNEPVSSITVLSLKDCIEIALQHYLPLQIAMEHKRLAKLRIKEARRSFYPAFLAEWKEGDGETVTEPYRNRSYGFQSQQPIFSGGKLMATLRKEQLGELIAEGNFERIKQDLILLVTKAYYEVVIARNTLDVLENLRKVEEKLANQVDVEFKIGAVAPVVFLSAQSFYNQVCFKVASAKREFEIALLKLEKEMFIEKLDIDSLDCSLSRKKLDILLSKCIEIAFCSRPELSILEKTIESAKYAEDIVKSDSLPNITIIGSYGRSGEAFNQRELRLAREWSLMGKVRWFLGGNTMETSYDKKKISPFKVTRTDTNIAAQTFNTKISFWDNLAYFSKQKEAFITRKQAEKDLIEMRNKIRQEVVDAYYSYHKFNSQLSSSVKELGYRRKQLEIVKAKKAMAEATGPEVMDAEMQFSQTNVSLQEALAGINIAIVSLNRAVGVIDYFDKLKTNKSQ